MHPTVTWNVQRRLLSGSAVLRARNTGVHCTQQQSLLGVTNSHSHCHRHPSAALATLSVRNRWSIPFLQRRKKKAAEESVKKTEHYSSGMVNKLRLKHESLAATTSYEQLFQRETEKELSQRQRQQQLDTADSSSDDDDNNIDHHRRTQRQMKAKTTEAGTDDKIEDNNEDDDDGDDESDYSDDDDSAYAPLVMTDEKGRIRFQRNLPGKPIIYEGFEVRPLVNPAKRRGRVHFKDWHTCRQAVLRCPSAMQGRMPMLKEVNFVYPRLRAAINHHGGWPEVGRRLGLKAHRVPPYYIPYLSEEEQYEFVAKSIQKNNALKRHT